MVKNSIDRCLHVVRFECRRNDESRTWLDKVFWTRILIFTVLNAVNTLSKQFGRSYSFEYVNLFNFGEDHLDVNDAIKWIYTTQDLHSILSDTKEWFRFRRRHLVWEQASSCSWHKHCGKEDQRDFHSHVIVSTVHKLESKTVISAHLSEQSLVSCNKRPSEDQLSDRMLRHYLSKPSF